MVSRKIMAMESARWRKEVFMDEIIWGRANAT